MPPTLRDRLLDAAAATVVESSWHSVTMAGLGESVGVSRQTVYNEFGDRAGVGQALVMRELDRFLAVVDEKLPGSADLAADLAAATEAVLARAQVNPLLAAVITTAHGGSSDLLPLLTVQAAPLIATAHDVVAERISERYWDLGLSAAELQGLVDVIVRYVLSNVVQPVADPGTVAATMAWLVSQVTPHTVDA